MRNTRAGLSTAGRSFFTDVVPFHEVAHQWWGNVVGWSSYRDQWINESIAEYLALLFADSQKTPDHTLNSWLDRYRKRLTTKSDEEDRAAGGDRPHHRRHATEFFTLARRLQRGDLFEGHLGYSHAARNAAPARHGPSKDPDARFTALLHTLVTKYAQNALYDRPIFSTKWKR